MFIIILFIHILLTYTFSLEKEQLFGEEKIPLVELKVNENDSEELEGDNSLEGETFKPEVYGSDLHEGSD